MIGIYKITSPSGKIYIGQSTNIKSRFATYRFSKAKKQQKLNNSFLKHGVESHKFEVIEICNKHELNDRESYYIDYFNSINNGLNIMNGKFDNMSNKKINKTHLLGIRVPFYQYEKIQLLRKRKISIGNFIREAIQEKIKNEFPDIC